MRRKRRESSEVEEAQFTPSAPEAERRYTLPFAQRFTCTINEACEVTGLVSKGCLPLPSREPSGSNED